VQSRSLPHHFFSDASNHHWTPCSVPLCLLFYCFLALKYRTMEHGKRKRTAFDQERETGTNHKTKKGQSTDQGKNTKCTNGTSELNRTPQDTRATYHCCPEWNNPRKIWCVVRPHILRIVPTLDSWNRPNMQGHRGRRHRNLIWRQQTFQQCYVQIHRAWMLLQSARQEKSFRLPVRIVVWVWPGFKVKVKLSLICSEFRVSTAYSLKFFTAVKNKFCTWKIVIHYVCSMVTCTISWSLQSGVEIWARSKTVKSVKMTS